MVGGRFTQPRQATLTMLIAMRRCPTSGMAMAEMGVQQAV
jgi:hypothetical protein